MLFAAVGCRFVAVASMYSIDCRRHSVALISCAIGASTWLSIAAWLFSAFVGSYILAMSLTEFVHASGVMACTGVDSVKRDCCVAGGGKIAWFAWLLELVIARCCGGCVVPVVFCVAVAYDEFVARDCVALAWGVACSCASLGIGVASCGGVDSSIVNVAVVACELVVDGVPCVGSVTG